MGKSFSRATVTANSKPFLTESKCDFVGNGFLYTVKMMEKCEGAGKYETITHIGLAFGND